MKKQSFCDNLYSQIMKIDLDVRTKEEWNEGHKQNALHFELARLIAGEIPPLEKDTELQVYCRSGQRSEVACNILRSAGFVNVHNAGGF